MASSASAGAQAINFSSSTQEVFHRLLRSLSGSASPPAAPPPPPPPPMIEVVQEVEEQHDAPPTPTPMLMPTPPPTLPNTPIASTSAVAVSAPEAEAEAEPLTLRRVDSSISSSSLSLSSSIGKARMKIADRLKQLGRDIGKLRKGSSGSSSGRSSSRSGSGSSRKSVPASPRITVGEVSSSPAQLAGPSVGHIPGQGHGQGHAKLLSMVAELEETDDPETNSDEAPSAATLARRIQALVDALPFPTPGPGPGKGKKRVIKEPKPPKRDRDGRPIPPPVPAPVKDSRLLSFLESATVMNGSTVKGRPSIWSLLEGLGAPKHGFPRTDGGVEVEAEASREGEGEGEGEAAASNADEGRRSSDDAYSVASDNTSVMVYSPLIPSAEDLVELAEQVPVEFVDGVESGSETAVPGTSWTSVWPLSIWYGPSQEREQAQAQAVGAVAVESTTSSPLGRQMTLPPQTQRTSLDSAGRRVRVQTVQAWVPSATKLSLQALWWGYRLYLPPPVLAVLSDKTLEATKRAAMITTALTWFFNNLPVTALPPPVQPAALLLQRIAPYLGYIGTFISWSWSTIKGYDIGYGVILSATWVLPVALIPSTWKENDFPKSPTQPAPIPLPPASSQWTPSSPPTSLPTSPSTPASSPGPGSPIQLAPLYPTPSPSQSTHTPPTRTAHTPRTPFQVFSTPTAPPPTAPTPTPMPTPLQPRHVVPDDDAPTSIPIPIAPTPTDVPPVPPEPGPRPVVASSELGKQLLQGPLLGTVPLPEEEEGEGVAPRKEREKGRTSRAKALFMRSPKH
ncbi:hypothetical protein GALMADRAFT_257765 [Galerina marginata CBS 339.88]|uniref:Uncharacterized protein n=1 Tax=Galerina marginata (strain CBS 339.88) TaxID=685588 RepID=A0A067SJH8_GALM3|nr:hypothetical protein GALMADRAFT_257765 [Galerina marginata CBS 339.88]